MARSAVGNVSLTLVAQGQENIKATLKSAQEGLDKTGDSAKSMGQFFVNSFKKVEAEISGLPGKVTDIWAAVNLGKDAIEHVKKFGEALIQSESDIIALDEFTRGFGASLDDLGKLAVSAGRRLTDVELAKMANQGKLFGLSLEQVNQAMLVANKIATETGKDFENLYEAIAETAAGTVVSADRFNETTGATLDLRHEMDLFAASTGRTADQLSLAENRAVSTRAVFRSLTEQFGQLDVEGQSRGWGRLGAAIGNATDAVTQFAAETTGGAIDSAFAVFENLTREAQKAPAIERAMHDEAGAVSELARQLGLNAEQTLELQRAARNTAPLLEFNTVAAHDAALEFELLAERLGNAARRTSEMNEASARLAEEGNLKWMAAQKDFQKEWQDSLKSISDAHKKELADRERAQKEAASRAAQLQKDAIEAERQLRLLQASENGRIDEIETQRQIEVEKARELMGRSALSNRIAMLREEIANERAALETRKEIDAQDRAEREEALRRADEMAEIAYRMDLASADRQNSLALAQIEREHTLAQIRRDLQTGEIDYAQALRQRDLAEAEYAATVREELADRAREAADDARRSSEDTLQAYDGLASGLQRSNSATARLFATTARLAAQAGLQYKALAQGSTAAILAMADVAAGGMSSERARAGLMVGVATATALLELARGNLPGAEAGFASAAAFAATAGSSGGGGKGPQSIGAGGLLGGGGQSIGAGASVQSSAFAPGQGGGQTIIVEGWRGQDLIGQLAGDTEAARRNGVDRRRI